MTKELEDYFNSYFEMFRSTGWKQLKGDLSQNAVNINSVEQTEDEKNLYFRKGQLAILATVLNLETQIDNAHNEAKENVEDDDSDEIVIEDVEAVA
jgi:ketosteroid isomerase-like protein